MQVTVTHRHCVDANYHSLYDDGLARAIKQQLREIVPTDTNGNKRIKVLASQFRDKDNNLYTYDTSNETGYNPAIAAQLKKGTLKERIVKITMQLLILIFCNLHILSAQVTCGIDAGYSQYKTTLHIEDWHNGNNGNVIIDGYHEKKITARNIFINFISGYNIDDIQFEIETKFNISGSFIFTARSGYNLRISDNLTITPLIGAASTMQWAPSVRVKCKDFFLHYQRMGDINAISIGFIGFL